MNRPLSTRLEQYTIKRPHEVLIVHAQIAGKTDQIAVFKGFSSSLMRPTAFDPDVPVLPVDAEISAVDRLEGPYNPQNPRYLDQGLSLAEIETLLAAVGV